MYPQASHFLIKRTDLHLIAVESVEAICAQKFILTVKEPALEILFAKRFYLPLPSFLPSLDSHENDGS